MKIEELIERLQEEQKIHPFAEVLIEDRDRVKFTPVGIDFDGQSLRIHPEPRLP